MKRISSVVNLPLSSSRALLVAERDSEVAMIPEKGAGAAAAAAAADSKMSTSPRRTMSLVDLVKMTHVALQEQQQQQQQQEEKNNNNSNDEAASSAAGGGQSPSQPPPPPLDAASAAKSLRLEHEISELSERTRMALESNYEEIAALKKANASRAGEIEALREELDRLGALRESNLRERCGELPVLPSSSSSSSRGISGGRGGGLRRRSGAAYSSPYEEGRVPRCVSAPDLEELGKLAAAVVSGGGRRSGASKPQRSWRSNKSDDAAAAGGGRRRSAAAASKNISWRSHKSAGDPTNTTRRSDRNNDDEDKNDDDDGAAAGSSSRPIRHSQSCLSFSRLARAHSAAGGETASSPTATTMRGTTYNRRRRRSLTELVSQGIAGIQDHLAERNNSSSFGNSSQHGHGRPRSNSGRRDRSNSNSIHELHHRLASAESRKLRLLYALTDKLRRREQRLEEASRKLRTLRAESEYVRSEIRSIPRTVARRVGEVRTEQEGLMADAMRLAESVRGKERQMRYLAVGIGETMAALAEIPETTTAEAEAEAAMVVGMPMEEEENNGTGGEEEAKDAKAKAKAKEKPSDAASNDNGSEEC